MREMTRCMRYPMDFLSVNNLFSYLPSVPDICHIRHCIPRSECRTSTSSRSRLSFAFLTLCSTSSASIVLLSVHATILREYRSITLVRLLTNPSSTVQIYVISVHHTAFGCSGLNSRFNRLCNVDEKSLLIVVLVLGWILPRFYAKFTHVNRYGTL